MKKVQKNNSRKVFIDTADQIMHMTIEDVMNLRNEDGTGFFVEFHHGQVACYGWED